MKKILSIFFIFFLRDLCVLCGEIYELIWLNTSYFINESIAVQTIWIAGWNNRMIY